MTLTQLRYIVAIVEAGLSITVAAIEIHETQSGMSKQLRQLEQELGFDVFVRRGRSLVSLTERGATVLDVARRVMSETRILKSLSLLPGSQRHEECELESEFDAIGVN
jgi:LysR family transcriptional regulator, cys regulon transcriptional activator